MNTRPVCPLCNTPAPLAIIKASDGREWINCACAPCGMAMDSKDQWTCYLGGVEKKGAKQ